MLKAITGALLLFIAGCAGSANTTPITPQMSGNQITPQVWQRGTPPVHWQIFINPINPLLNDNPSYSWPLLDKSGVVAFGVTCCGPNPGEPPQGSISGINYSGSRAAPSEKTNTGSGPNGFTQIVPVKIFQCAGSTQMCSKGEEVMFGPNEQQYFFGYGLPDATAGTGNTVWATTNSSFIVSGTNGVKHLYSLPASRDHVQAIAFTSDGNVWVSLRDTTNAWRLAKLDPSTSHVTIYPLQLPASPQQLFVGPDGNLWFAIGTTLYHVNKSTAQLTRSTLPLASNGYLNAGPGNTIWTAYNGSTQGLLEISPSGTFLGSFACPVAVCNPGQFGNTISQATTGPDGNIWFAFSPVNLVRTDNTSNTTQGIGVYVRESMSVSPSTVDFGGVGQTQTITFSEANYSGSFTAASTAPGVVRVVKLLTPHEVQIRSVAPGNARIIIRDTQDNYFGVIVTVK